MIYLDNNATTQPDPRVVEAIGEVNGHLWANPSSVHRFGQMARHRVELARAAVASLVHCRDRELVFTAGGTEANNLALRGVLEPALWGTRQHAANPSPPRAVLITTEIEHSAIREPAEYLAKLGATVVCLPLDAYGQVHPDALAAALNKHARGDAVTLVSIHWANNETGIIEPIAQLAQACQAHRESGSRPRALFHTDATQAVGKIPVNLEQTPVDLMSMSAHKLHGPKGVGALFVRQGVRLSRQIHGGAQERERRGGTENTPSIVGFGVAADQAQQFLNDHDRISQLTELRDRFERVIVDSLPDTVIHAEAPVPDTTDEHPPVTPPQRLWNTSNLGFPRLESEAILLGLSERGLCASAGAACSSGSLEPSPVLLALGVPEPVAHGSVRFSLSRFTTDVEVEQAARIVIDVVKKLARSMPLAV